MDIKDIVNKCVHCGKCTKKCEFLHKYKIDLGDTDGLQNLLYHCFLCDACKTECPVGISGKELILALRRKEVSQHNNMVKETGYDMLIKEKSDYLFRNYQNATEGSVLFPGCNFPSFYPRTTKKLMKLLKDCAGIGTIFDCCGKPIAELGMEQREFQMLMEMETRLSNNGIQEVIMLCPNCYEFLKPKLNIRVVTIYEVLERLGIGSRILGEAISIFLPCPDREQRYWLKKMHAYLPEQAEIIEGAACCGLGGCARAKEPEISKGFSEIIKKRNDPHIFTYCGSCAGKFARDGCGNVHHVLADILGTGEKPDVAKSLLNRARSKFW